MTEPDAAETKDAVDVKGAVDAAGAIGTEGPVEAGGAADAGGTVNAKGAADGDGILNAKGAPEIKGALEALLFAAEGPLSSRDLCDLTGLPEDLVVSALDELSKDYASPGRGIELVAVAGGFRLLTRRTYHELVRKMFTPEPARLSQASLETLAIIAYRQPLTRAEIENIRGVRSDATIRTLMERGLIEEVGRKEGVGRPILYGTTRSFLEYFGLNQLQELPPLPPAETGDERPLKGALGW